MFYVYYTWLYTDCKSTWRHLQQEDKGKLCIVIRAKIIYVPIYQNQPVCLKQMLNYQRLWAWCQLCYISQELILFTYAVVIKKGKLQHAAVYIGSTTCHKEVLWRLFFWNVKIITWSLCCWPQDLQRIINFELTDILQTTIIALFMVKRSFCAQVTLSLKLQQRCNRRTQWNHELFIPC